MSLPDSRFPLEEDESLPVDHSSSKIRYDHMKDVPSRVEVWEDKIPLFQKPTSILKPPKSPTHYISDRFPPIKFIPPSERAPRPLRKEITAEEREQARKEIKEKLEYSMRDMDRILSLSPTQFPLEEDESYTERVQLETRVKKHKPVPFSTATVAAKTNALRTTLSPSVPQKVLPLEAPTVCVPRYVKEGSTARQSFLQEVEALRLEKIREKGLPYSKLSLEQSEPTKEHEEPRQSFLQELEVLRREKHNEKGLPYTKFSSKPGEPSSTGKTAAPSQSNHIRKANLSSRAIKKMKERRNGRLGTALHPDDDLVAGISPFTSQADRDVEEIPLNANLTTPSPPSPSPLSPSPTSQVEHSSSVSSTTSTPAPPA